MDAAEASSFAPVRLHHVYIGQMAKSMSFINALISWRALRVLNPDPQIRSLFKWVFNRSPSEKVAQNQAILEARLCRLLPFATDSRAQFEHSAASVNRKRA